MNVNRDYLEKTIIAIALHNPSAIAESDIHYNEFLISKWRIVFQSIRSIISGGLEIDVFSVSERTSAVPLIDLAELQKNAPSSGNLNHYVAELRKLNRSGTLIELCGKSISAVNDGKDPDKVKSRLMVRLSEQRENERHDFNIAELSRLAVDYLEVAKECRDSGKTIGVPTGIRSFDKDTGGLHKSHLIVVGARPGVGKTAYALTTIVNAARLGYKAGFISTEMSGVEIGLRLMSQISCVPGSVLRDASMTDTDYSKIMSKSEELKSLPIRVMDKPSCTLADIMIQAKAWQINEGIDFIIVDYLQRLVPEGNAESRTREVGKFAAGLKTLARQLKIPVVALSQLNRESAKRADKRPTMADLRDSGEIEQEADLIVLLHRPHIYDEEAPADLAEVIVEKNRHGPLSTILTHWNSETMRFSDRRNYDYAERYSR